MQCTLLFLCGKCEEKHDIEKKQQKERGNGMWNHEKDKNVSKMMLITLILVGLLLAAVIFCFTVLKKQEGIVSSDTAGEVYIIRGKDQGSNRYERSDHLSYTDSVRYTWEELSCLDSYGLRITRNEIYARHGRMFSDQDIQDYFNHQEWYVPQSSSTVFDESCLNEVEQYNVELIRSYELQQGY